MKQLTEREEFKFLLAGLDKNLVIDHAEASLFRSVDDLADEAGCWYEFYHSLLNKRASRGNAFGMRWRMMNKIVDMGRGAMRFAGWLAVDMGNEKLIVSLLPHYYTGDTGKQYLDQRFVVASSSSKALMTGLIFKDVVLGKIDVEDDPPWMSAF